MSAMLVSTRGCPLLPVSMQKVDIQTQEEKEAGT